MPRALGPEAWRTTAGAGAGAALRPLMPRLWRHVPVDHGPGRDDRAGADRATLEHHRAGADPRALVHPDAAAQPGAGGDERVGAHPGVVGHDRPQVHQHVLAERRPGVDDGAGQHLHPGLEVGARRDQRVAVHDRRQREAVRDQQREGLPAAGLLPGSAAHADEAGGDAAAQLGQPVLGAQDRVAEQGPPGQRRVRIDQPGDLSRPVEAMASSTLLAWPWAPRPTMLRRSRGSTWVVISAPPARRPGCRTRSRSRRSCGGGGWTRSSYALSLARGGFSSSYPQPRRPSYAAPTSRWCRQPCSAHRV